jgi:uncharacterized membrane protein YedE/YeeE
MSRVGIALIAGGLFGAGLAVSGMANPARVQGFLDLFGDWDPSLVFVMGGALIPMALAWALQKRTEKPFAAPQFDLPETMTLDRKLVLGAVLFGAGWGLTGLCPGPAVANIAIAPLQVMPFILAMFGGMALHRISSR